MPHYAKCDVISRQNKKIQTEIPRQQIKTLERKTAKELVLQF